jgi:hypothetical protein
VSAALNQRGVNRVWRSAGELRRKAKQIAEPTNAAAIGQMISFTYHRQPFGGKFYSLQPQELGDFPTTTIANASSVVKLWSGFENWLKST